MKKFLLAFVYKSPLADSTNGGLSSQTDKGLLFESPHGNITEEDIQFTKRTLDHLVIIKDGRTQHFYAVPSKILKDGKHSMFGGNFIYTSDSRFPSDYPIAIHDRVEY